MKFITLLFVLSLVCYCHCDYDDLDNYTYLPKSQLRENAAAQDCLKAGAKYAVQKAIIAGAIDKSDPNYALSDLNTAYQIDDSTYRFDVVLTNAKKFASMNAVFVISHQLNSQGKDIKKPLDLYYDVSTTSASTN